MKSVKLCYCQTAGKYCLCVCVRHLVAYSCAWAVPVHVQRVVWGFLCLLGYYNKQSLYLHILILAYYQFRYCRYISTEVFVYTENLATESFRNEQALLQSALSVLRNFKCLKLYSEVPDGNLSLFPSLLAFKMWTWRV